jgi:hypothetical protein
MIRLTERQKVTPTNGFTRAMIVKERILMMGI